MPTVSQEQPEQTLPHCVIMKYTVLLADYEDRILAFNMERFQAPPSGSGCSASLAVKADWTPLSSDTCRMRQMPVDPDSTQRKHQSLTMTR